MDKDKAIQLLKTQQEKLDLKGFDLDSWKNYTIIILGRIFGDNSRKIRQIEDINFHFGSWSLRDTSGKDAYLISCKKLAKEILQASIDEIDLMGFPEHKTTIESDNIFFLLSIMEEHSGKITVKEIKKLLKKSLSIDDCISKIEDELNYFSDYSLRKIIAEYIVKSKLK
ncbi:MAG: hypothetical protein ACEPOV_12865 [Hyphomicrobiales bacterium]